MSFIKDYLSDGGRFRDVAIKVICGACIARFAEAIGVLTVGAVIKESLQTTLQFVSWYLEQGADQIVLCFDDLEDPAIEVLQLVPQVKCVRATETFLKNIGMTRDRRFVRRQNKAVQAFYRAQTQGWFLHVDGDELLYLEGRTIAEELARAKKGVRGIRFLPAEHLNTPDEPGGMHFRLKMQRPDLPVIYGKHSSGFVRRQGLIGHHLGKSATRVGIKGAFMRQHFMHFQSHDVIVDKVLGPTDGAYLLHFVDQGYDVWRAKLPWRLDARGYSPQIAAVMEDVLKNPKSEKELRKIYDLIHVFEAKRRAQLADIGCLLSIKLDRDALVRRHFPDFADTAGGPAQYAA